MTPINLFDSCIKAHTDGCSGTHGKKSKLFEYVYDGSGKFDLYTKHWFDTAHKIGYTNKKIGWLLEAKTISPSIYKSLYKNKNYYFEEIGFKYIYTYDEPLLHSDDRFRKMFPGCGFWIQTPNMYNKNKLISMIVSNKKMCPGHLRRLNIAKKWSKDADIFGRGINPIDNKEEGLCDYMFSIACENEIAPNSISEKLLDCFATGTIPIYLGHLPSVEKLGFNMDGVIPYSDKLTKTDLTEKLYYNMLDAAKANLNTVKKYEILIDYTFKELINEKS